MAVQAALLDRLASMGWKPLSREAIPRAFDDVMAEDWVTDALVRLNPVIAERPERAQDVLTRLRAVILSAPNDGLVAANEEMVAWLCGRRTMRFVGTEDYVPVGLIDFDHPDRNHLVITTETTYTPGTEQRRFDAVLWVNGLPLVVGETKTPISWNTSWLDGAVDIHDGYERRTPGFFVPNVLSFATEGKEFRYGAVRQPAEMWLPWSRTTDEMPLPGLASVLRSAELLLAPRMILEILRTYTLFSRRSSSAGGTEIKIIPRYAQVEAVEAIVARVRDPKRRQGLVWHHQGSGETLLMAFAVATAMARFEGVDRASSGFEQLYAAQERLPDHESRDAFAADFLRAQGLFEFLWPDTAIRPYEADYKWLARIYKSVAPTDAASKLLWQRLGVKTAELIHEHVSDVRIDSGRLETVAVDAEVFEALRQMQIWPPDDPEPKEPPTLDEVLDRLETRLRRKLAGPGPHPVWQSLAERLKALRKTTIDSAAASVEFLKQLLEVARDLVAAEKAEEEGRLDEIKVVDPHRGALTQILEEYAPPDTPVIIENVVEQIDEIVRPIRGTGWQTSQPGDREVRRQLRLVSRNGLPPQGDIFDRAYAYIREHY